MAISSTLAVRIFSVFALGYFLSYALRSVNAAIAPGLVSDLGLSASQLGSLSSAYLLSFALMQLPLGGWLDRYGPRRTEAALLLIAALGCFVFAMSQSYVGTWLGRALIGVGVSGCLMAAYKGFREYFPQGAQSRLAAWMLMAGTAGALTTTVPVQRLVAILGWRPVFLVAGALLLISALAIFKGLPKEQQSENTGRVSKDAPTTSISLTATAATSATAKRDQLFTLADVVREPYFWRMALLGVVFTGGFIALQSLWLGPWLTNVLAFTPAGAANSLFAFNLVLFLAYLLMGWLMPRAEKRGVTVPVIAVVLNALGIITLLAASWLTDARYWWIWLVLPATTTINTLTQTYINGYFPVALAGRANSLFNLLIFAGAFCWQSGLGLLIDYFKSSGATTVQAYQQSLWIYIVIAVVTWMAFVAWRPVRPQLS